MIGHSANRFLEFAEKKEKRINYLKNRDMDDRKKRIVTKLIKLLIKEKLYFDIHKKYTGSFKVRLTYISIFGKRTMGLFSISCENLIY